jgi:uncharacterized membrane protein
MTQLNRIVRGAATVGVIAACELGTHYAASTPGAEGFGFAVVIAPLLLIALAAAATTRRVAVCGPLRRAQSAEAGR